jgi:hypothetical protein
MGASPRNGDAGRSVEVAFYIEPRKLLYPLDLYNP